ncbi:MAG: metallophosphoesterase [Methylophilaceae bacterium]|nr:metallophosphoesterase [Methyloradius sp.]
MNKVHSTSSIQPLKQGPLDIIGDVHGELDSLNQLLEHLGYGEQGEHTDARHLVFVGDLCDRGPDSPGVIRLVRNMVEAGNAQMVLGNHEISFLRDQAKDGSGWYQAKRVERDNHKYAPYAEATIGEILEFKEFLSFLPVALEREDLRIVHAAWDQASIEKVREIPLGSIADFYNQWEHETKKHLHESGLLEAYRQEQADWKSRIEDEHQQVDFLHHTAKFDEISQMYNPIRVLTSGVERKGTHPFYSSGKWRFVERVGWWNDYADAIPVVVGHYWRKYGQINAKSLGKGDPDLFVGISPFAWLGLNRNVFCVDYSVGGRWRDRKDHIPPPSKFKLGALQWPENKIVFDDGSVELLIK